MSLLKFHFDFISPFGYFASLRIDDLGRRYGYEVEWSAMLLGVSVRKVMGLPPLLTVPLKGSYLVRDAERCARRWGIPYRRPSDQPPANPLHAARLFHWTKSAHAGLEKALACALYRANFVDCVDIADEDVLRRCAQVAGIPWTDYEVASRAGQPAELLRSAVDTSIANGVFGSPFFLVDDEPFFGVEKLPDLEHWLATGGW